MNKNQTLFNSAQLSVDFARFCLEPVGEHLRAKSSFVNPQGEIMHWHEFGDLVGPGWAANGFGGADLLYRWGQFVGDDATRQDALFVADHILEAGYVQPDGFVWPYYDKGEKRYCLNYTHNGNWLCPGSLARIGVQALDLAVSLGVDSDAGCEERKANLINLAQDLSSWLEAKVPLLQSGWVPRRITRSGDAYPLNPHGDPDIIYDHSADGLFLLQLWALTGQSDLARALGDAFVAASGHWGSINHDTFDHQENVAYAIAFRVLRQLADSLERPEWHAFAYQVALPGLARFRMDEDRNGVITHGLFYMEDTWDTAYLWENAEVAQAYLEAWSETGNDDYRETALGILQAISQHHYGEHGFLTEGVDWNNHVGQQHHIAGIEFGAIQYTEPLLNNLHLVLPTLTLLTK